MHGTDSSPEPTAVSFDDDSMWVMLEDGRTVGVPLAWFPRLLRGSAAERENFFLSPAGIHWETLDEDIAVATLLRDRLDMAGAARAA